MYHAQIDFIVLRSFLLFSKSTAAIIFHNKVQLTDHRFSATIYGLNRDKIAYVVIIYGRRN